MAETPIRLLIPDDNPIFRDGIRGMFADDPDFEVLGEAGDGAEAVALARALNPDVILMDLRMPRMDGVATTRELTRLDLAARVLVLTTYDTDRDVLPAVEAGAIGYLLKDTGRDELLRAAPSGWASLGSVTQTECPFSREESVAFGTGAAGVVNR